GVGPALARPRRSALGAQLGDLGAQRGQLALERIDPFAAVDLRAFLFARGAVRDEFAQPGLGRNQRRTRLEADHRRALGHVLGDHRVGADARALADHDRADDLRARADDDVVPERRVALAALAACRVGAAQRDALVDGHVVADLGGLAD